MVSFQSFPFIEDSSKDLHSLTRKSRSVHVRFLTHFHAASMLTVHIIGYNCCKNAKTIKQPRFVFMLLPEMLTGTFIAATYTHFRAIYRV